jgi:hypothetical protein
MKRRRVSRADFAAIVLLGAAGSALSYDALRQMAEAMHVRPQLTYLFPLLLDGFIGYGVRALVLLRDAAFRARLYAWTLFGTATTASVWANALHAVRLNQEAANQTAGHVLRLGNWTVGALSTLAPLALGGAVHLYIVISRHLNESETDVESPRAEATTSAVIERESAASARLDSTESTTPELAPAPSLGKELQAIAHVGPSPEMAPQARVDNQRSRQGAALERSIGPDHPGGLSAQAPVGEGSPAVGGLSAQAPVGQGSPAVSGVSAQEVTSRRRARASHLSDPADDLEILLPLARVAAANAGRLNRTVVSTGLRQAGHRVSNERITAVMEVLRQDPSQPPRRR